MLRTHSRTDEVLVAVRVVIEVLKTLYMPGKIE